MIWIAQNIESSRLTYSDGIFLTISAFDKIQVEKAYSNLKVEVEAYRPLCWRQELELKYFPRIVLQAHNEELTLSVGNKGKRFSYPTMQDIMFLLSRGIRISESPPLQQNNSQVLN